MADTGRPGHSVTGPVLPPDEGGNFGQAPHDDVTVDTLTAKQPPSFGSNDKNIAK